MSSAFSERQTEILEHVRGAGRSTIELLAQRHAVSPQTIRRDVNALCAAGMLRRVHGGVQLPHGDDQIHGARRGWDTAAQDAIGTRFARRVPSGASLAVSIGATPEAAIRALRRQTDIFLATNNLNIALLACDRDGWNVAIPGGTVRPGSRDIVGPQIAPFFDRFQVDFGVVGAGGVAEDGTLLDVSEADIALRMVIVRNCRRSVLLLDHTLFERPAHMRGGHLRDLDIVVCDRPLPEAIARDLSGSGVEILVAETPT